MAKQTKGKRKLNRTALKRRSVRKSQPLRTTARRAFPGGASKTESEVHQVVPRTTRS
jgi:hypothetical protein